MLLCGVECGDGRVQCGNVRATEKYGVAGRGFVPIKKVVLKTTFFIFFSLSNNSVLSRGVVDYLRLLF